MLRSNRSKLLIRSLCCGALALASLTAVAPSDPALAQAKIRVEVYTLPSAIDGTDFGRKALLDHVATKKLTARQITEKLFEDYTLIAMSDVLRTRVLTEELTRLDKVIDKGNLVNIVRASTSAEALAATLDEKGISEGDLIRGLGDVFDGEGKGKSIDRVAYYPKEAVAYWVGDTSQGAQRGYNEKYILDRLLGTDKLLGRPATPVRATVRFEDLERLIEKESARADEDNDDKIWRDEIQALSLADQLELYFGLAARNDSTVLKRLYEEAALKDKYLTQDTLRVFEFSDAATAASVLEGEGLGKTARYGFATNFNDLLREDGVAIGLDLLTRLEARITAQSDWLRTIGDDVSGVYVGSTQGRIGTPSLSAYEKETWKSQADRGLTRTLIDYFSAQPNMVLVLYSNNSVRAHASNLRYEGLYDPKAGTLTLEPVYGGQVTLRYEGIKLTGDGLFMELEAEERTEGRRTILRRTRRY